MIRYILRRLVMLVPVAVGITMVVFLLVRLIPGDPARTLLGIHATPELVAAMRAHLGLDRPLWVQYLIFVRHLAAGDFGHSDHYGEAISRLVLTHLGPTLVLIAYSIVLTLVIALPAGLLAAVRRDQAADHLVRIGAVVGVGLPSYWIGFMLILLLAVTIPIFPVAGYGTGFPAHLFDLFLPALTIAINLAPLVLRALRASLMEALASGYIDTARAKGLPRRVVLLGHALPNAIVPAVTVLGLNIGYLVGSTVIVETVFAVPGLGQLMINSIGTRDYPVIQAVTLVLGVLVVLVNLATDLMQLLLDPRVRREVA